MYSGIVRNTALVRGGAVTGLTDDERRELSDKVREANRRSAGNGGGQ